MLHRSIFFFVLGAISLIGLVDAGGVNSIPIVSQAKSTVEAASDDMEAARRTQEEFLRQCPGVSQATSAFHAMNGDSEEALKVQMEFLRNQMVSN